MLVPQLFLQIAGRRYFDEEVVATGKSIVEFLGVDLLKKVRMYYV